MVPIEQILLITAVLVLLAFLGSKASHRRAQALGVIALVFILFSGGFETYRRTIPCCRWG